jgi:hypothetical protein
MRLNRTRSIGIYRCWFPDVFCVDQPDGSQQRCVFQKWTIEFVRLGSSRRGGWGAHLQPRGGCRWERIRDFPSLTQAKEFARSRWIKRPDGLTAVLAGLIVTELERVLFTATLAGDEAALYALCDKIIERGVAIPRVVKAFTAKCEVPFHSAVAKQLRHLGIFPAKAKAS